MTTSDDTEYHQVRFTAPPGATELFLVRHGQSKAARPSAPFPLVDGHADPELSELGRQQAVQVAARLNVERFDAAYVTNLRRTAQTAAPFAELCGLTPRVEAGLREVRLGEWEGGLFRKMLADNHPTAQRIFTEQRWDVIPGAEPADEFAARVEGAVDRIVAAHPGQRVVCFIHGGVVGQILARASGSRGLAFSGADNCSISHIVVTERAWIVRRFNDTAHLDPAFTLEPTPLT